jgi:hypothetical protein
VEQDILGILNTQKGPGSTDSEKNCAGCKETACFFV